MVPVAQPGRQYLAKNKHDIQDSYNHVNHMVHSLPWCGGLHAPVTWRAMPAGTQAPGRVTYDGQGKGWRPD